MTIKWIGSPNFDTHGRKKIIQVVIHWFGSNDSTLASTDSWFQRPGGQSAHYGIEDDKIHQYVKEEHTAYAVGNLSRNQETISIEHSANLSREASEETLKTSGELVRDICLRRNIPIDRAHIIGHKEIKATQCPGTVNIDKIINYAKQGAAQSTPMDDRAHFFDLIFNSQKGFDWGTTDSKKVTKAKIAEYNVWVKDNVARAGASDLIRDEVDKNIDITKISAGDFIKRVTDKFSPGVQESEIRKDERNKTIEAIKARADELHL